MRFFTMFASVAVIAALCHRESATQEPSGRAQPAVRVRGTRLCVNQTPLAPLERQVAFRLHGIWRYEPERDRWVRVVKAFVPLEYAISPSRPKEVAKPRVLLELPEPIGLYYVAWAENGEARNAFGFNGPVNCNDVTLGEPPVGKVAVCIPFENSAKAKFVPDPRLHCK